MRSALRAVFVAMAMTSAALSYAQADVGAWAPDFLGSTTDGKDFKISTYRGKVVVASFWASWCGPCRRELPLLEGLQKVFGHEKVKVVAISIESEDVFRQISKAATNLSLQFIHDSSGSVSKAYGMKGVPHLVIVGRDGLLMRKFVGYSEEQVEAIINEVRQALREQ